MRISTLITGSVAVASTVSLAVFAATVYGADDTYPSAVGSPSTAGPAGVESASHLNRVLPDLANANGMDFAAVTVTERHRTSTTEVVEMSDESVRCLAIADSGGVTATCAESTEVRRVGLSMVTFDNGGNRDAPPSAAQMFALAPEWANRLEASGEPVSPVGSSGFHMVQLVGADIGLLDEMMWVSADRQRREAAHLNASPSGSEQVNDQ